MAISELDPRLTIVEAVTPHVETALFDDAPESRYWVGCVAVANEVILPAEFTAARMLRANVYIEEMGFLDPTAREADGGESDADDERSVQFAVIENRAETGEKRLVGTSRLIMKRDEDDTLPVEQLFPEAFKHGPAPAGSVEASRFIARHPNKMQQHVISLAEMRAMDLRAISMEAPYIYAVIEQKLAGLFDMISLPYKQLTELRMVEEYNTENMAVEIEPEAVLESVRTDVSGQLLLTQFFKGASDNLGVGYYDETLQ